MASSPTSSSSSSSSSTSSPVKTYVEHTWNTDRKPSGIDKRCRWTKHPNGDASASQLHRPFNQQPSPPLSRIQEPSLPLSRLFNPPRWSTSRSDQEIRESSPPPYRFHHPLRGFAAAPPRFPSLIPESTAPPSWFQPQPYRDFTAPRESTTADGFERLSLFRGRDWRSESDHPNKGKSPAKPSSSVSAKKPRSDGGGELNVCGRNPLKKSSSSSYPTNLKDDKSPKAEEVETNPKIGCKKPSFMVKIGGKEKKQEEENPKKLPLKTISEDDDPDMVQKAEKPDEEIKVWNLRPRNVKAKKVNAGGGGGGTSVVSHKKKEKKKKLSIEVSLTKEEIEDDIFALTGAKPSRRPKKHPKNVQRQLDTLFPGLWLLSITSDSYKVSESSTKG